MDSVDAAGILLYALRLSLLGLLAFGAIDTFARPAEAFVAAGKQTKPLWLVVLLVGSALVFFFGPLSIFGAAAAVAAIVYVVDVRPALRQLGGH